MQVVEDVTSKTLQQVIGKTVATGAKIECDGYRSYKNLSGCLLYTSSVYRDVVAFVLLIGFLLVKPEGILKKKTVNR